MPVVAKLATPAANAIAQPVLRTAARAFTVRVPEGARNGRGMMARVSKESRADQENAQHRSLHPSQTF